MDVVLNNPVAQPAPPAPPAIASVRLLQATYSFTNVTIDLVWNELDAQGNQLNSKTGQLDSTKTAAFFATPVAGAATLHDVFEAAFLAAIEGYYGAGVAVDTTLTPGATPPASP